MERSGDQDPHEDLELGLLDHVDRFRLRHGLLRRVVEVTPVAFNWTQAQLRLRQRMEERGELTPHHTKPTAVAAVGKMVDDYGYLAAEMAALKKRQKRLRGKLAALGQGAYEGQLFRVTVSEGDRETLNVAAVREHLSPEVLAACTDIEPVTTVRCHARNAAP